MFNPGDKVLIALVTPDVESVIDRLLNGAVGTVESPFEGFSEMGFDYCVRVGKVLYGLQADQLTLWIDGEYR